MKKTSQILSIIALSILIIILFLILGKSQQMTVVLAGNINKQPINMAMGKFQGSECGMVINDLKFASQVIGPDGKTWFFDDHGCMAAWISARPFKDEAIIWVKDLPSGQWIEGKHAWYSRVDQTPMSYGFGAYRSYGAGLIDFATMQQAMLNGETLVNSNFPKQLVGQ